MSTLPIPPQEEPLARPARTSESDPRALRHLGWIPAGAMVGWAASFLFGDLVTLPVDLYYLIYFTVVIGFFGYYVRRTDLDLRRWVSRRLGWALALGVVGGLALMPGVLSRPATAPLSGSMLAWAILYRGVAYGAVDGLLLFAFPWIVVWRAFHSEGAPWGSRLRASSVAFVAMLLITTTYHLGYRDFRSSKIAMPNLGSAIGAVPTLVAANPVASAVSHVVMHVTSVVHSPASDLFLPPHRSAGGRASAPPTPSQFIDGSNGILESRVYSGPFR